MKRLINLLLGLSLIGGYTVSAYAQMHPVELGTPIHLPDSIRKIADQAMDRRAEKAGNLERAAKKERWSWGGGVLMFGLLRSNEAAPNPRVLEFIKAWIDHHYEAGFHLNHTDRLMPAGVVAEMIWQGELDARYDLVLKLSYDFLQEGRHYARGCPGPDGRRIRYALAYRGRSWLDDLFMNGLFMARYGDLLKDPNLRLRVADQFLVHLDLLQCHGKNSRLLNHGQWLGPRGNRVFPPGNVAWARANGWYLTALAEFLGEEQELGNRGELLRWNFVRIIEEVRGCQKPDGLFPTVLDRPESYGEVAATALFVHAAAAGLRHEWLRDPAYLNMISRGLQALFNHITPDGKVVGTSGGTPVLPWPRLYQRIRRGTFPWGEGTVMMALVEVQRLVEFYREKIFEGKELSEPVMEFLDHFS